MMAEEAKDVNNQVDEKRRTFYENLFTADPEAAKAEADTDTK